MESRPFVLRFVRLIFATAGGLLLAACGGDSEYAPLRPAGTLQGVAHDGPIAGGTVTVFSFAGGIKGPTLGAAITDDNGAFTISVTAPSQPVWLELEGGKYREEASGKVVTLRPGATLKSVAWYESGAQQSVTISPFSMLAAGLAEFRIAQGSPPADAVNSAIVSVSQLVGVTNVVATTPINITTELDYGAVDDRAVYAFSLASLSSYTAWVARRHNDAPHEEFSSLRFANLMYEDLKYDGLLDGRGPPALEGNKSALEFANVTLNQDVYRQAIAQHMLVAASSKANVTGISAGELLAHASGFAASNSPMFPGGGVVPRFDFKAPEITAVDPIRPYYRGVFDFKVRITDESPVRIISFNVDGAHVADAIDPATAVISIDSSIYGDGPHVVGVTAFDEVGNLGNFGVDVYFDNTAPVIRVTSPSLTNQTAFDLTGVYERNGAALRQFTVQGRTVALKSDLSWSTRVLLNSGQNKIPVIAEDEAGNRYSADTLIAVDGKGPEMVLPLLNEQVPYYVGNGRCVNDRFDSAAEDGAPLYFNRAALSTKLTPPYSWFRLLNTPIPFIRFYVTDPPVAGIGSDARAIKVTWTYKIGEAFIVKDQALLVHPDPEQGSPYYLIPIASDLLPPPWPGDGSAVHSISIGLKDEAGNQSIAAGFPMSYRVFVGDTACQLR